MRFSESVPTKQLSSDSTLRDPGATYTTADGQYANVPAPDDGETTLALVWIVLSAVILGTYFMRQKFLRPRVVGHQVIRSRAHRPDRCCR